MYRILCSASIMVALCASAFGQTATGTLQGRVTDPSGATLPDATVTVTNVATGVSQTLQTSEQGSFVQPYLGPGQYTVTVEKQGFQRNVTSGVNVEVQRTADLNITMSVGEVSTTVEVNASAVQLATTTSATSTVINSSAILDLPLNGRNPFSLATLTPGVVPGGGSTPWISGGRNSSSEITIDGTSVILPENNVSINQTGYMPIVDSIAEFSVITTSLSAEYGRTGGGVINVATRSGTNEFHGSLFEFLRNSKLDANSWANNRNRTFRAPPSSATSLAARLGGPISIPEMYDGENRTFFFFAVPGDNRQRSSLTGRHRAARSMAAGRLLESAQRQRSTHHIYDPLTVSCDSACDTPNAVYVRQPFRQQSDPARTLRSRCASTC